MSAGRAERVGGERGDAYRDGGEVGATKNVWEPSGYVSMISQRALSRVGTNTRDSAHRELAACGLRAGTEGKRWGWLAGNQLERPQGVYRMLVRVHQRDQSSALARRRVTER